MGAADSFNAGDGGEFREKFVVKLDLTRNRIAFVRQRNIEEHRMVHVKARRDVEYVEHALDEQPGADEQSKSEGGLRDHQRVVKAVAAAVGGCGEAEVSQGVDGVGPRHSPSGKQSEDERRGCGK